MSRRFRSIFHHDLLKRSALFSASVVASTVVGLVSIPLINSIVGKSQWADLALLQIIGTFASIIVAFGWGATGPATVSSMPETRRRQFLLDSLVVRVPVLVVTIPIVVVFAVLIGLDPSAALLAAVAYATPGVGAAWYFIGTNRPGRLLLLDATPAIIGQIVGLFAVVIWADIRAYLAAMALSTVIGVVTGLVVSLTDTGPALQRPNRNDLVREVRRQSHGLVSLLFGNVAIMLPSVMLKAFAPASLPVFMLVDKFFRYGVIVLGPILQAVQGWIGEEAALLRNRARVVFWFSMVIGLAGGTGFAALATPLSGPMSAGEIVVPWVLGGLGGIAFAAECVGQLIGLAGLVAVGRERVLSATAVVGSVLTIALLIPATTMFGVTGTLTVIAVPLVIVAIIRATALWRATARPFG